MTGEHDGSGAWSALREPFPPEQVGQLPKGGVKLDYVGHGAVTSRLLEVDPEWNWEPVAFDTDGLPLLVVDAQGNPIGMWIRLTVCGVTRLGYGSCTARQNDAEKVLIGDALRNAAMRFGVALDLWVRGHAEDDEQRSANDEGDGPSRGRGRSRSQPQDCAVCGESLAGKPVAKTDDGYAHRDCARPAATDEQAEAVPGEEPF